MQINKICKNLSNDKKIEVTLNEQAFNVLADKAIKNLSNGGRGIGNIVESLFINPLSRYIFDNNISEVAKIDVVNIDINSDIVRLITPMT